MNIIFREIPLKFFKDYIVFILGFFSIIYSIELGLILNFNDSDDDPDDEDVIEDSNINAPEAIMDDIDLADKAAEGDQEALETLKDKYPSFFEKNDDKEGLKQLTEELEDQFPVELDQSEREADELEERARSRWNNGEGSSGSSGPNGSNTGPNSSSDPNGGPSGPSGPSGSNEPNGSSENGSSSNVRSKLGEILIGLGGVLEQLLEILQNLFHY